MRRALLLLCLILAAGCGPSKQEQERAAAEQNLKAAEQAYAAAQKEYARLAEELGQAEKAIPNEKDEAKKQELKQQAAELDGKLQAQKQTVEQAINNRVKAQDRVNAFAE